MKKIVITTSIIFALYYIFFIDWIPDPWIMVFKLIPMILFIMLAIMSTERNDNYALFVCIGLIFCAIGDYTLQWFIVGLSFFLTGHIFYIVAFTRKQGTTPSMAKGLLILFGATMAIWLFSTLWGRGETILSFAVLAYIFVILTMGWTSFRTQNRLALFAALLFILSDSVLAINRFIVSVPASHELIMLTYYGAQLLFALSIRAVYIESNALQPNIEANKKDNFSF